MKQIPTLLIFLFFFRISAQNLVPNGDFEQYKHCPTSGNQIDSLQFWTQPTLGTSEYFSLCGSGVVSVPNTSVGYQMPRSGAGFVGMSLWSAPPAIENREYVEVKLDSTLTQNTCYHFEMYINNCNFCKVSSYVIGAYFSDTIIKGLPTHTLLTLNSQINNNVGNYPDTLNWTLVSGNFTAHGGERFLIIGNFKNDASTVLSSTNPSAFSNWAYILIDDVSLARCSNLGIKNQEKRIKINVFPNPVKNQINIETEASETLRVIVYDVANKVLLEQKFNNTLIINTERFESGIYFYQILNRDITVKKDKFIKN